MKNIIPLLLLLFVPTISLFAQAVQNDSIKIKTKIAIADARRFKSNKAIRIAHRHRLLLNTSDYFTPTVSVKNPQFLKDSVYVKAYRDAAYNKSIHNNKSGYYAVVATKIIVITAAGAVVVVLLFTALLRKIDIK